MKKIFIFLAIFFLSLSPVLAKNQISQFVHQLLESTPSGGIGQQVREVARLQNQAQEQIDQSIDDIDSRPQIVKKIFGYNKKTVKQMEQLIEQNQHRIEQLTQLSTQTQNQADQPQVQNLIYELQSQQTSLNQAVSQEKQFRGVFGWLKNLFTNE